MADPSNKGDASQQPTSHFRNQEMDRINDLFGFLSQAGLMSGQEASDFEAKWGRQQNQSATAVAAELCRLGKLTSLQWELLRQGKGDRLIVGNYVILDLIGKGGMGQVYKAWHRKMDRLVAIKTLHQESAQTERAVRRFQQEVRVAARLIHPNVVTAYDACEANGMQFLVMEYVPGTDLKSWIAEHNRPSCAKAIGWILQACLGLEYAHGQGVLHRDLKPSNLLLTLDARIKVLDMGLARIDSNERDDPTGLTRTGDVFGTIDFMAPEQAIDTKSADQRADIYSLGCTLFYLLTGQVPFPGKTFKEKLLKHRNGEIPSIAAHRDDVPEWVDTLFRRMVAKRPEDRPSTVEQIRRELERNRTVRKSALADTIPFLRFSPNRSIDRATSNSELQSERLGPKRSRLYVIALVASALVGAVLAIGSSRAIITEFMTAPKSSGTNERATYPIASSHLPQMEIVDDTKVVQEASKSNSISGDLGIEDPDAVDRGDQSSKHVVFAHDTVLNAEFFDEVAQAGNIRELFLYRSEFSEDELLKLKGNTSLIHIGLDETRLTDTGAQYLGEIPNLEIIGLSRTGVSHAGLVHIAKLKNLRELFLVGSGISDNSGAVLGRSVSLIHLDVRDTAVGDEFIRGLSGLSSLQALIMYDTSVTDLGLRELGALPGLVHLGLDGTAISDSGLQHLSKLPELRQLGLMRTKITDEALRWLSHMPQLTHVWIDSPEITEPAIAEFCKTLPDCIVFHSVNGETRAVTSKSVIDSE